MSSSAELLDLLRSASGPTVVALLALALWREALVPGSRYRAVVKERDELQAAVIDKVIPAVTEANIMARQFTELIQHDVSLKKPGRSE